MARPKQAKKIKRHAAMFAKYAGEGDHARGMIPAGPCGASGANSIGWVVRPLR